MSKPQSPKRKSPVRQDEAPKQTKLTTLSPVPRPKGKATQEDVMLAALKSGPVSSLDAREACGIIHPAGRVMRLRRLGYSITTRWTIEPDAWGRFHRIARYVLIPGGAK